MMGGQRGAISRLVWRYYIINGGGIQLGGVNGKRKLTAESAKLAEKNTMRVSVVEDIGESTKNANLVKREWTGRWGRGGLLTPPPAPPRFGEGTLFASINPEEENATDWCHLIL